MQHEVVIALTCCNHWKHFFAGVNAEVNNNRTVVD
jgi:hypothetical protein